MHASHSPEVLHLMESYIASRSYHKRPVQSRTRKYGKKDEIAAENELRMQISRNLCDKFK